MAAYLLLFSLTRLPALAFIGALAFAHSPVLTSYFGPQSLIEPYLFVFFVLASYPLFRDIHYGRALGAGVLLGLSVYNYPYYFVAGLVWLGLLVAYRLFPWTVKEETGEPKGKFFGPGRVPIGSGLGLTALLVLIPKEWWEMLKIGRILRTEFFLSLLLLIYLIRRIKKRKAAGGHPGVFRVFMGSAVDGWVRFLFPKTRTALVDRGMVGPSTGRFSTRCLI